LQVSAILCGDSLLKLPAKPSEVKLFPVPAKRYTTDQRTGTPWFIPQVVKSFMTLENIRYA
jgi:hypothetical protein